MSFTDNFEAAKNIAKEAAQTAAAKAKELAAVAKANISIYAEEDKVKKAEIELGKLYYRDYAVGEEMDTAEYLPQPPKLPRRPLPKHRPRKLPRPRNKQTNAGVLFQHAR